MLEELTENVGTSCSPRAAAPCSTEENRARLRSRGFTVYLKAPIELLVERTARDRNRPLLETDDPKGQRFTELMAEREPLYQEVADLVVKTNQRTARYVVRRSCERLDATCEHARRRSRRAQLPDPRRRRAARARATCSSRTSGAARC